MILALLLSFATCHQEITCDLYADEVVPIKEWTMTGPVEQMDFLCSYWPESQVWLVVKEPDQCVDPETCCYSEDAETHPWFGDWNGDKHVDLMDYAIYQRNAVCGRR